MERPVGSSSESGAGKALGHQQACPGAVEKELATLSGSVLGTLQTQPLHERGLQVLGGKPRGEQSRCTEAPCQHRLRAPSVPEPQAARPPGHPTRQWLPSTLCGCWLCSLCGTKLAPDQGGAGSAATPGSKQPALALCLHPHTPPGEAMSEPHRGGPRLSLQEAENGRLPHQAPSIIRSPRDCT